jgi:hypothetical protein
LYLKVFGEHFATTRPVFMHGPQGPGPRPRAANFQGWHIKKKRLKYGMRKKGCPQERNLREIYTENTVGTEFSRYDARRS